MARDLVLAIDSGTTSTRAIVFDRQGQALATAQHPLAARHPFPGWVEQDAKAIRDLSLQAAAKVLAEVGADRVAAIGIANQRETAIAWDRHSGDPLGPAIVWQDRRTADDCARLRGMGEESRITALTGLLFDPYFSATKFAWLLREVPAAADAARAGRLALGTVDSWLLFALTGGKVHATDPTNASRTLLMLLAEDRWDRGLCELLAVPESALPAIRPSAGRFGECHLFGPSLPVTGVAGDQQAALVGQGCLAAGEAKCTYGTGIFLLAHGGAEIPNSGNRLVATRAATVAGEKAYALEGSVFVGGDAVKWLRDSLGLIRSAAETEVLAASVPGSGGVQVVPAFSGLGAPWWEPHARGIITGITAATGRAEIARAVLEAMGNQTADLLEAFARDGVAPRALHVDGGMVGNDWLCQDLADSTGLRVVRPQHLETTAIGAAMLAGVGAGLFGSLGEAADAMLKPDRSFTPRTTAEERRLRRSAWARAVAQALAGVTASDRA
ncbi:glycerol kinase GlpK [Thermaurantiacus sp.]